jgi:molybdopterin-guanine dinucleotide biosynthesis protein A
LLILAGGQSRRMGSDKAWLTLQGRPLVERVARRALPLCREIIFSTNQPEHFDALCRALPLPCRLVADAYQGTGPLAGLHAGLAAANSDLVLALATDMPFVNLALLRFMAGLAPGYDAVVPFVPQAEGPPEPEPLHAFYRRTCLPAITAHLEAGHRRLVAFHDDVKVRRVVAEEITPYDPALRSFLNANNPDDWARAEEWAAQE